MPNEKTAEDRVEKVIDMLEQIKSLVKSGDHAEDEILALAELSIASLNNLQS